MAQPSSLINTGGSEPLLVHTPSGTHPYVRSGLIQAFVEQTVHNHFDGGLWAFPWLLCL